MSMLELKRHVRRAEAERLIDLAMGMLVDPAEEIAAIYLDHALDSLRAIPAGAERENVEMTGSASRPCCEQ